MSEARGWIGRSTPRRDAERLAEGRGRYTDDLDVAHLGYVAFLRSPHAHARIVAIGTAVAKRAPGVIAIVTGDDLAAARAVHIGAAALIVGLLAQFVAEPVGVLRYSTLVSRLRWSHEYRIVSVVAMWVRDVRFPSPS